MNSETYQRGVDLWLAAEYPEESKQVATMDAKADELGAEWEQAVYDRWQYVNELPAELINHYRGQPVVAPYAYALADLKGISVDEARRQVTAVFGEDAP